MAQNDSFDFEGFDVPLVDVDPHAYEEAQLAAAIAASLADVDELPSISGSTPPRASRPIDAISVGSSSNPSSPRSGSDRAQSPDPVQTLPSAEPAADIQASAFLGERAALERARLVRQKRRREETTDESLPQTPGAGPSSSPIDALGVLRATKQMWVILWRCACLADLCFMYSLPISFSVKRTSPNMLEWDESMMLLLES